MRIAVFLLFSAAYAGDWSAPVDVLHEMKPCVTYRARMDGDLVVIQAKIQPGWHTFAIDNERRAAEKLAGKASLGIEQPTTITLGKPLERDGAWYQTIPKDFSKPDIRWYTWGYEREAVFAARVRNSEAGAARVQIRGQACTDTTCKNIDVTLSLPLTPARAPSELDLRTLVAASQ